MIYIALVEFIKYILEIMWEYDSPATLYVCSKPYDQIYVNGTVYNDDISAICEGSVVVAVRKVHGTHTPRAFVLFYALEC